MRFPLPKTTKARVTTSGIAALAIVVPVAIVAAQPVVSNAGTPRTATSTNSDSVATRNAGGTRGAESDKLLTTSDLGAGWTEVTADELKGQSGDVSAMLAGVKVTPAACAAGFTLPEGYQGESHRIFKQGSAMYGPYLATGIAVFASPQAARGALTKAKATVSRCRNISISVAQGSAQASLTPLTTAALGDQTVGLKIDATVGGFVPAAGQIIVVRKGNTIVAVAQGGIGASTVKSTKAAAAIAASRI